MGHLKTVWVLTSVRLRRPLILSVVVAVFAVPVLPQVQNQELTPSQANSVLDQFKAALDERWSYRHANNANFDAAILSLRHRLRSGISKNDLGIELQRILALGIDGHSRVT